MMGKTKHGLTQIQRSKVEEFLHLFADIEKELKKKLRLRPNASTAVGEMVKRYLELNPSWIDSAHQMWTLAAIRNLLTHHRSTALGYPVAVTHNSVTALERIKERLVQPEPVSIRYRKEVMTVSANDSLASVVAAAFKHGFSQFPVVTDGTFRGLITENEITRWLGRRAIANDNEVNLTTVDVKTLLKEKDPSSKGIPIFCFEKLDAPVEEVMGLFAVRPMLEVVLLTTSGNNNTSIEGIITQWDAARYPQ